MRLCQLHEMPIRRLSTRLHPTRQPRSVLIVCQELKGQAGGLLHLPQHCPRAVYCSVILPRLRKDAYEPNFGDGARKQQRKLAGL